MKKRLIPKEGIKVTDPQTGAAFPPEGANRMLNSYYVRRINEGSLTVEDADAVEKPKKQAGKGKKQNNDEGVE